MRLHNPENERIKRRYFTYLKEAKRYSEATVDRVAKSLSRFEEYTRSRGFKNFRVEQAVAFKRHFADQVSKRSGERLSKATLYATLTDLRNFFHWLAGQTGFRSRLGYADADYFNLSEKDSRIARAQREQPAPTLDQILHAIRSMPASTEIDRRDRAVVAFTILSGARDGAIASMTTRRFACARASRSDCVAVWNEYR
jgi:site-specific recombinase XerC